MLDTQVDVGLHVGGVLARIEALVEGRLVEAHRRGVRLQFRHLQLLLVGEQPVVQLPVLALVAGAVRRLGRLGRLRRGSAAGSP